MKRLASVGLLAVTSMASAAAVEQGEVVVEMVAEDGKGRAIADPRSEDVVLAQGGARQVVRAFRFVPELGYYELRYVPESGRSGAVAVRVARDGVRLRGPDGPQLKVRWVPPVGVRETAQERPGRLTPADRVRLRHGRPPLLRRCCWWPTPTADRGSRSAAGSSCTAGDSALGPPRPCRHPTSRAASARRWP